MKYIFAAMLAILASCSCSAADVETLDTNLSTSTSSMNLDIELGDVSAFNNGVTESYQFENSEQLFDLFIVKQDNKFQIFITTDPNNGCSLSTDIASGSGSDLDETTFIPATVFYDPCHGNQYNINGELVANIKTGNTKPMRKFEHSIENGQLILGEISEIK